MATVLPFFFYFVFFCQLVNQHPQAAQVLVISPASLRWRNFSRKLFAFAWAESFRFHRFASTSRWKQAWPLMGKRFRVVTPWKTIMTTLCAITLRSINNEVGARDVPPFCLRFEIYRSNIKFRSTLLIESLAS